MAMGDMALEASAAIVSTRLRMSCHSREACTVRREACGSLGPATHPPESTRPFSSGEFCAFCDSAILPTLRRRTSRGFAKHGRGGQADGRADSAKQGWEPRKRGGCLWSLSGESPSRHLVRSDLDWQCGVGTGI